MSASSSVAANQSPSAPPTIEELVKSIGIPPRPGVLIELHKEMDQGDPDLRRVARLVSSDVALTASLLRIVNSPAFALARRCETVDQAISMLGLKQVGALVTGTMLRKALPADGLQLTRFWDVSAKRSQAMTSLARGLRGVDVDIAQSFGLFCDVGIPLLMRRFPDYGQTLKRCNDERERNFTEVERAAHLTDHAYIGGLMGRTWCISPVVCQAVRSHHDYATFHDAQTPPVVARLVAMGLMAEVAIQRFARLNNSVEWDKGGDMVAGALVLSEQDVEDWIEQLVDEFAHDVA